MSNSRYPKKSDAFAPGWEYEKLPVCQKDYTFAYSIK
jgi:hypothetical protein